MYRLRIEAAEFSRRCLLSFCTFVASYRACILLNDSMTVDCCHLPRAHSIIATSYSFILQEESYSLKLRMSVGLKGAMCKMTQPVKFILPISSYQSRKNIASSASNFSNSTFLLSKSISSDGKQCQNVFLLSFYLSFMSHN